MPPRKDPKEQVIYPASKRKPQPFKPQRPTKIVRTSTEESTSSSVARQSDGQRKGTNVTASPQQEAGSAQPEERDIRPQSFVIEDFDISDIEEASNNSSDDLPDNPLETKAFTKRPTSARAAPMSVPHPNKSDEDTPMLIPEIDGTDLSQPLLLRLMHEHFEDKETRIDKHAIKVLQRYVEIFLRESVARAAVSQKADVDSGAASQSDQGWLDKKDLEKIAGGIILDF